jgi:hypothetical protein
VANSAAKRFGATLALLALALQLVLTFGHFHPEDFAASSQMARLGAAAPDRSGPLLPALPGHDDCALCVNLSIANSTALAAPPAVPPPAQIGEAPLPLRPAPRLLSAAFTLFRSRAPPAV